MSFSVSSMMHRLGGQPTTYDKKSQYRFGRTLGAGTYGIVREADGPNGKCAIKIILKKNLRGNEQMVFDELQMLQRMKHPHIVHFETWFESKDKWYIVTELATGGELFDRICDKGKFTEKDAAETIRQVLDAVNYLHERNVVHRGVFRPRLSLYVAKVLTKITDLKPENLLYLTKAPDSELVLADFGIAKTLEGNEVLTTMAGSFGYAAPEVMEKKGHGKAVDLWSLGVITYTLLCGYSPFRSESMGDLIEECRAERVIFHPRYWSDVSQDAKDFIKSLLKADPSARPTSQQALRHIWLTGKNATEHNLLPEIRAYVARARLRRGVELVKLANRIESLRMQEDDDEDREDVPGDAAEAAGEALVAHKLNPKGLGPARDPIAPGKKSLSKIARGAIFREVVLAKVREMKEEEARKKFEDEQSHATK